ncbi:MAG: VCBS repeat-containing protein, partial [candidate division WOR-3 bacterium]
MIFVIFILSVVPYPNQPNWESTDTDYSTGGALVDVDLDGDIDFVSGNGNDMAQNRNKVNYNYNDTLQHVAGWQSSDVGYNAHISLGDINYDGYPDLVVANYGDPYTPQYDKFY